MRAQVLSPVSGCLRPDNPAFVDTNDGLGFRPLCLAKSMVQPSSLSDNLHGASFCRVRVLPCYPGGRRRDVIPSAARRKARRIRSGLSRPCTTTRTVAFTLVYDYHASPWLVRPPFQTLPFPNV